jgi:hypothetical protein
MGEVKLPPEDEYLDIIDVIGFLWRSKWWTLSCLAIGIAASTLLISLKKPPVYVVTMPVRMEISSGLTSDEVTSKFNRLNSSADVIETMRQKDALIVGQSPIKLLATTLGYQVEVSSESPDPLGVKAVENAKLVSEIAKKLNARVDAVTSTGMTPSKGAVSDLEQKFSLLAEKKSLEEAPVLTKIYEIEARLAQKLGSSGLEFPPSTDETEGDQVLRLIARLGEKLTQIEKQRIIADHSRLVGEMKLIRAKYEEPVRKLSESLRQLSQGLLNSVDQNADKFPVYSIDEATFQSLVGTGSHQRYESKKTLLVILGAILGAMMGLFFYGTKLYFEENKERLRRIVKS